MKEQNSNQVMFDLIALCQEDLGPLCQNWFEELTLSACSSQFKQPGGDVHFATSDYNNDYFKTPWQKQTLHSQLDCTPSVFSGFPLIIPSVCTSDQRNEHSRMKPENSFSALGQGTVPPYKGSHHTTSSPVFDVSLMKSPVVLIGTCRTPQHIHTTQDDRGSFFSSPVTSKVISEQILESLGAEVDPDMSWTSSLATPPSLTPTVIICKAKESELLQDKAKEVQVPLLLHSNLNIEHNAYAFGQHILPVIGEEECEEMEGVDQSCKPDDGVANLVNESRSYKDGKQTVPDEAVSFTECTPLGLRGIKSNTVKRENKLAVNNLKINGGKALPSHDSLQSTAAQLDFHMVSNNLAFSPVKDCKMKGVFLNSKKSVDQHLYDRSSEELSGHNISSLSDWSQLNLSELDESQMINGGSDNVDRSAEALSLSNTENLAFLSNEKDMDKGFSCFSGEERGSVARNSACSSEYVVTENHFNCCRVAEDFKADDESINNSKAEAKSSTPNCTCDRSQLSKLLNPLIPDTNYFVTGDSVQSHPSDDRRMDSDSENVAVGSFPSCKLERVCIEGSNLESKISKIKPVTALKDHKASLTDSINNGEKSNQPVVSRSTSLVLDPVKCQVAGEDHSLLLSALKGHSRKFLYSVQDPLNQHEHKNISLATDLQIKTQFLPLASKSSCMSSARKFGNQQNPAPYRKNEDGATPENILCIDLNVEASGKHGMEANEILQDRRQLFEKPGKIQDVATHQHLKDETFDKLSHAFNNDSCWDNFVTPLNRRHSHNKKERKIFATACRTVAKRLNMESKIMTNSFDVQAEDVETICTPAVINCVQAEKANVSENTVSQNNGRFCEFRLSPLTDAKQSSVHHDGSETTSEDSVSSLNHHDTCIAPFSAQLSTNVKAGTSVIIHTISSHSSCICNVLHKTEQLCLDSEKCKKTLKNKSDLSELQIEPNIETVSICLSQEKHFEGSLIMEKELLNTNERPDLHNSLGSEKRECSDNTNLHIHNRKVALKARKLKTDISDAFLVSTTVLPECEIECKENPSTEAKKAPCNLASSALSGLGMHWSKSSELTGNLHNETRAAFSAFVTKAELYEPAEITQFSHNIELYKGENTDKTELKSGNPGADLNSVIIKETCTVLENTKKMRSEDCEAYKCGPCNRDLTSNEQCTDLLTENPSQGKSLKKFENDNLEANSAQAAIYEVVTSENIFENQKGNCPISSINPETKSKSPELQLTMEVVKQSLFPFTKTCTFNSSETLSQKKLLGDYKCLTASQAEDVNKLFTMLEDTNSQFEFTQFGKESAVSDVNKGTNLLIKQLDYTPPPVLDKWQDVSFHVQSSMILNNKPCNSQQRAEFSKMGTSSEICQQITEEMDQTVPSKLVTSFGFINKNKGITALPVPKFCTNSSDSVNMHMETMLNDVISPLKDKVNFKGDHGGFCTASGSEIKLSAESLKKAENVFKNIGNDLDQTNDRVLAIDALSCLLSNSISGSEKVTEVKLRDTEVVRSSESYLLHPGISNLNSKDSQDNILQNEKIVNSDRKDDFQTDGNRSANILEEATLHKAMYLSTEQDVLERSDRVDEAKLGTVKNMAWEKNVCQSDCNGAKDNENMEFGSKMELSDDDLLSGPFASHIKSSDETINTEESNDITCFQTARGKGVTVSKTDLNKATNLLEAKDCCSENFQKPKLLTGIEKNASQQLDKRINTSQMNLKKNDVDMQLCDQKQATSGHSVSAAFIVPNSENSEACNSLQNIEEIIVTNAPSTTIETGMKGFQTASGKMVNVCKASLDKAKALFAEKDLLNETKYTRKNSSLESLLPNISTPLIQNAVKSGGVKQLKDNRSHVNSKSHSRLNDLSVQSKHIFEDLDLDTNIEMKGFQMASGKQVSVSKIALNKGRALFLDDHNRFSIQHSLMSPETFKNAPCEGSALNDKILEAKLPYKLDMMNEVSSLPPKQCLGHCAADGSSISVGEANLKYTEENISESEPGESKVSVSNTTFDNNQGNFTGDIVSELPQLFQNTGPIAFSTASGKPVQISEESVKNCKQIFAEIIVSEEEFKVVSGKDVKSKGKRHSQEKVHSDTCHTKASLGFNTASGKPVLVSDVALQKVKCMLKESEMNNSSPSSPKCAKNTLFEKAQQLQLSPTSSLFSDTMSNEQRNKKDSQLAHGILDDCTERTSNIQNSIQVELSKKKINDLEVNRPTRNLSASCSSTCMLMSGFQTGKEVMVEESSLTMARIQLASNKNDKLSHAAEKSNILAEGRIKSICSASCASTPIVHELKTNPKILEENVEKWTTDDSKAAMDHDEHLDFMLGKAFRYTHAFTDQTIGPDLRTGKRLRSEGKFTSEEPLPKRQLLSEFDNTLQNDHASTLKPLKCNPEGALHDRRKFMYNVPLKPVICSPSKVKSLSNNSHQQMISPNVAIPIHEDSVRQDLHLYRDIKLSKGQAAVFKPPFHSHSGGHRQLNKSRRTTSKTEKTFLPPFKTLPSCNQMEKQGNTEAVFSPMQNESESNAKVSNCSGLLQDGGPLNDDLILARYHEDKLQSITGTSEELKASNKESSRMVQNWHYARNLQEMRLMKKKRETIRPLPGSLCRSKTCSSKLSLHTAVEGKAPTHFTEEKLYSYGVNRSTLCVRAENAESFQINSREFFSEELLNASNGLQLADGGCLIPDDNGMAGKSEFYRALLDTPGVDSNLISEVWAYNHYRWLVWKLAAMEIAFPKQFGGRCLTPERILLQLKYRYDVEIDQSRRSALKKVMERDDVAAKTLVLCISKIVSLGSRSSQNNQNPDDAVKDSKTLIEKSAIETKKDMSFGVIEVTDGWYGIKALLDSPLTNLLRKRRLVIGQKIIVHGAELIGSQEPCSPLEAPESLMIKISANSTRPARWYAKLGFHCDPRPFPLPLSSLFCEGGMVGCVDVIVVRIYPIQWMEKSTNGMYVFRNERAEEREAQVHLENQQRKLEMLYAKIEAELQDQNRVDKKEKREHKMQMLSEQQIMMLQDGKELYEAVQNSSDPLSVEVKMLVCVNSS
ncbi:breast cancer type 2 susceptibility protein isoform X2 [Pristis pectinata]|uniref:breast cancer type 2 susceptibility protein isoform X2 n=1 Tax=Pristis pectinata TaxID=685728 RepID=UPI00223E723F|nr:breast cancer type 2 susceptibility protein isoform X2 [Pristis pectinata]